MLKGWNRKVRITSAISRAGVTAAAVSPKPLSDFVPDVTLIFFPIPVALPARWQSIFLTRIAVRFASKEMVLILIERTNSGANPNSLWFSGVLDGCSQPRNQQPSQNLLIH